MDPLCDLCFLSFFLSFYADVHIEVISANFSSLGQTAQLAGALVEQQRCFVSPENNVFFLKSLQAHFLPAAYISLS